jgi:xanthine dehydrogenase accessory factor
VNIYSEILSALEAEEIVMLATIISTSGSTPASSLSKMLVKNNGTKFVGTIGGGFMENEVQAEAKRLLPVGRTKILTYHLKEDEFIQGLICGGTLDVLIEPIIREQLPLFQEVIDLFQNGQDCFFATFVQPDGVVKNKLLFVTTEEINKWIDVLLAAWKTETRYSANPLSDTDRNQFHHNILRQNEIQRIRLPLGEIIIEPLLCTPDLFIFGGGHIGKALCNFAVDCGFRVVVIDDREQYTSTARFPKAAQILPMDFQSACDHISIKSSSYIVIATREHQYDEIILGRALQSSATYIGMIGSRRKVETIYNRLLKDGIPLEQLKRVYAPIGIEIEAVTPDEIAVSIAAQLIRVRHGLKDLSRDKSEVMYSFFHKNVVPS